MRRVNKDQKVRISLTLNGRKVAASVRMKDRSAAEVFGELRERKNKS